MQPSQIQQLLISKSNKTHHINRYMKFVMSCKHVSGEYVENHHICPKASDLFPEYEDVRQHPWNNVVLTARQHIIAHVMLWKIFGGSQTYALDCILDKFNSNTNPYLAERKVPASIMIRYHAQLRTDVKKLIGKARKGKAVYKDSNGNRFLLDSNDPRIKEDGLVGNNAGKTHTEKTRLKISKSKYPNKSVRMFFLDCDVWVKLFSAEFSEYLAQGWTTHYLDEDREWVKQVGAMTTSNKMKNRTRFCLPDGTYYGMLYKDDPLVESLGLVVQYTENNKKQLESIKGLGTAALTGSNIYNNGLVEARFKEPPTDSSWVLGRLPRSESHSKNQKEAARKAQQGKKAWNNGIICKRLPEGEIPEGDGWVMGLLPRKKKVV